MRESGCPGLRKPSGIFFRGGKLPVISGGTGFYIKAFQEGLSEGIGSDPKVRKQLEHDLGEHGPEELYRKLAEIDPDRAAQLHVNDTFRIMRALEVFFSSGKTFSEISGEPKISGGDYDYKQFGLKLDREILYSQIERRVNRMLVDGLVEEIESVLDRGYNRNLTALDTVGYKEWFDYIDGIDSFENCCEAMKRNTRRYAKRQMTWFRAQPDIDWIDTLYPEAKSLALDEVELWLNADDNNASGV